ncbi:hypothetical protein AAVH_00754 [Aphelenchoides avenae]|nr:hypothetical protein AAVH_00754 [Aphelenchus avenae]
MPLATNGTVLLAPFVYPLAYWPEGSAIEMTDFISRAYLDQCQRFGARFCRNCPVHYRELGGEDGYDQASGNDTRESSEADFAKQSSC